MAEPTLLVTGASGHLARRAIEVLLDVPGERTIIATTRRPDALADLAARGVDVRAADFDDEAGLDAAFAGAQRALLVSTDAVGEPGRRVAQHRRAIDAFARAKVRHLVYTSAPPAKSLGPIGDDHRATEAALQESPLDFTVLRNGLYMDLLLASLPAALAAGALVDARGDGAVAWITRDDCARVAAAMLLEAAPGRRAVDVVGAEALTSPQLAALVAEVTGRPLVHAPVSEDELIAGMTAHGLPAPVAAAYAGFDRAIARGELARSGGVVERLTGTAATSVRDFLTAHRAALT